MILGGLVARHGTWTSKLSKVVVIWGSARSGTAFAASAQYGLGARVASWTSQTAIHGTLRVTRPTAASPTHVGGNLQRPLGTASRRLRNTAWALEWLAGPVKQQSTALCVSLAQPLHLRPTYAQNVPTRFETKPTPAAPSRKALQNYARRLLEGRPRRSRQTRRG